MENKTNPGKTKQQEAKLNIYGTLATQRKQPVIKKHKNLTIYNHEEVSKAATAYFKGDSLAGNVWMNKYALKDSDGNLYEKDPDQMHHRIAAEIARIENKYPNPLKEETIYEVLKGFKHIVPQGSPMAGIGNDFQISSLSNCFVIGNPEGSSDSYGGIMKIDQEQVQLMKRRGGVGHDLSNIRPAGSPVKNSALTSTGIVPFMERYSNSTREVAQDGRRGALMLTISVKHPDAESFIDAKMEKDKVTGANISVKIDDDFMKAVTEGTPYKQQYPVNSPNPTVVKEIDARKLWKKIVHNAWASAEPGILFWDTVTGESVPDSYKEHGFETVSTNPCGEIPLCPYDSCRLLAINLFGYVEKPFTPEASFDFDKFKQHVGIAQRMMDDIVDLEMEKINGILNKIENDPEDEETKHVEKNLWLKILEKSNQGRRTGIGITGEGDMLAALGLTYGTDKATSFSVEVHKTLAMQAYRSSVEVAKERGAFPVFDFKKEKNNPFIKRLGTVDPQLIEDMKKYGRRNIALLTIAPTGSVSICTQTTSGIEPAFLISYKRKRKVNPNDQTVIKAEKDELGDYWEEHNVFHHNFLTWLEANGYDVEAVRRYDQEKMEELIAKSPYHKATSNDIDWIAKVKMQGAVQKWVDHSISVTVNLPENINEEMVSEVYETAWRSGCKGMTIYRDGSRSGVLVKDEKKQETKSFKETNAPKRPKELEAEVVRFQNAYEKWVAVVGLFDGHPYEIFTGLADDFYLPPYVDKGYVIKHRLENGESRYDFRFQDKQGYNVTVEGLSRSFNQEFWNYAKLISGVLRHGMPIKHAVHLIENLNFNAESINTWKNGVIRALKKYIPDGEKVKTVCPECGLETLEYKEGCLTCSNCGYSKCS
jgi:ribonucleoside-diphosphate reductase alpha chain